MTVKSLMVRFVYMDSLIEELCCLSSLQKDVKDVFTAITFEVAYSLGKHVLSGHHDRDLPALTPVLRWRKGNKIAVKNEVIRTNVYNVMMKNENVAMY